MKKKTNSPFSLCTAYNFFFQTGADKGRRCEMFDTEKAVDVIYDENKVSSRHWTNFEMCVNVARK